MSPRAPELLLITDAEARASGAGIVDIVDIVDITRRALEGASPGRVAVQLRSPGSSAREQVALGHALRGPTREAGALLLVNRRPDVARIIEADGVHLPESGLEVADARRMLGEGATIGSSCHDRPGLERAAAAGADYATLSPIFAVPGKAPPLGLARFAEIRAGIKLPVLALGGLTAGRMESVVEAGADGVALIRGVYRADDPAKVVAELLRLLDTARARRG